MKTGRPRKLASLEAFDRLAYRYFDECENGDIPPTIAGLAVAVGLSSTKMLWKYEQLPEFRDAIKRAKLWIEGQWEQRLYDSSPQGAIFYLKVAFGWSDKPERQGSGAASLKAEDRLSKLKCLLRKE